MQLTLCPLSFAFANAGSNNAARMPMMAITTRSSMSVNPQSHFDFIIRFLAFFEYRKHTFKFEPSGISNLTAAMFAWPCYERMDEK
jgi:hypothetical protein